MSRSNPNEHAANPAVRWFEWNGETGTIRHYDKEKKENVTTDLPFTFVLLDRLGSVGGWHDASQSGIYSNEVRDTRQDVLVVKAFKGGTLAEGLYKDIKDRVNTVGGKFVVSCYVAFKLTDKEMAIGGLKLKGAALGPWMDFEKANRAQLYKQAIEIHGFTEGKKGRVTFRMPSFRLKPLSDDSNQVAIDLDKEVQTFLTSYLKRAKREQVEAPSHDEPERYEESSRVADAREAIIADEDLPF